MKKTIVRLVAVALLAVMLLSALPAFAAIVGTLENTTSLRKKPDNNSTIVANAKGQVTINYQSNDGMYYQVTISHNGQSATGWVPKSAVTGVGRQTTAGSGSITTGSTGSTGSANTASGTYTGVIAATTPVYDSNNKLVANVKGSVTVNYRNAANSMLHITITGNGQTVTGWVSAAAVSGLQKSGSGSITISSLPTSGAISGSAAAYNPYAEARTAVSNDSTIYIRKTASSSTSSSNVEKKVRNARGATFTILGQDSTGQWLYANYGGAQGFVRARDFSFTTGAATGGTTGSTTGSAGTTVTGTTYDTPKTGIAQDSTIFIRRNPDSSTSSSNVAAKIRNASGSSFSILGESGSWYYAQYGSYTGYVRKQDFTLTDGTTQQQQQQQQQQQANATTNSTTTSGAPAGVGTGSSSERWGSFTVPGSSTYPIYGNYTNKAGNLYYYDYANIKSYKYLHTTTAAGSQIQVVMGHNMRDSRSYFHNLHHIQNALGGYGKCEHCGNSCSTSTYGSSISASLDGYSRWEVMCLYEIPKKSSTSILVHNAQPWKTSTKSYVDYQLQYARSSGYKGWVNPNVSYSDNGKYMMLITCGDKYDSASNSTAKLYMLLKAVS